MEYAHSQYGMGNTQILIDLAWVFRVYMYYRIKIHILKYRKEFVETTSQV